MARIVKEEEYAQRRKEILDAALRLVYSKGFEQMTVHDILSVTGISKGAFYHYFDSKSSVLEALVAHLMDEVEPIMLAIVQDQHLNALEKLHRYFDATARWKTTKKALLLGLLRIWYADENAILRLKVFNASLERITPLLTDIIQQGVREGVFKTPYPEYACQVNIYLLQGLSDTFVKMILNGVLEPEALPRLATVFAAYNDAVERVLGAEKGSIHLMDLDSLREWLVPLEVVT
jgi:TetR/AcrR family transcriptional repressor of nem operon